MREYETYKDSGVEVVGEIPSHWEVKKLKYFGLVTLGKMLTPEDGGGYHLRSYLRSVNIQDETLKLSDVKEMWFSDTDLEKYRLRTGDVLVNEGGDVGRSCIWNDELEECYIQNSVNRLRVTNSLSRFVLYLSVLYHHSQYYDSLVNRVSIPHLTKEKLEIVKFVLPPLPEQEQIVSYLNEKTTLIDWTIENKTQRIELLKEMRSSLISEVVTKGLNPNVPMKDSGVEWVGKIPTHWSVSRVKFVTKIMYGDPLKAEDRDEEGHVPVYGSNGIVGQHNESLSNGPTIIIGRKGSYGKVNLSEESCYPIDTTFFIDTTVTQHNLRWLYHTLGCLGLDEWSKDSAVPGINREEIYSRLILCPLQSEQEQIVSYLHEMTSLMDEEMSREERSIDYLKEIRQSLIHEVVTGKRDVRGGPSS